MGLALVVALGALQGLTEFLPVSSSGHLRLLAAFFGVAEPQTLFDIMLHIGTLVAVVAVYGDLFKTILRECLQTLRASVRSPGEFREILARAPYTRLALYVCVATVPTGLIAIGFGDVLEALAVDVRLVGAALIVNGGLLLWMRVLQRRRVATGARSIEEVRLRDALVVGTLQGLGIMRGISRSGSTITAGLMTGLDQEASAAFSFLLAVPAIIGALILKFDVAALSGDQWIHALLGAGVAAIVGTLALRLLLRMLRVGRLHLFAWYCFALGAIAIWTGVST
jgi:undecaprenyl-diphosphatase